MRKTHIMLAGALVIGAATQLAPVVPVVVLGGSMEPTFRPYEVLFAQRDVSEIQRGDVVVFNHDGERMIKRVIGLPGDRITEYLFDDETRLAKLPKHEKTFRRLHMPYHTITVPEGQVYVTGDNENGSVDSRIYGTIDASSIDLKVMGNNGAASPASDKPANRLSLRKVGSQWL